MRHLALVLALVALPSCGEPSRTRVDRNVGQLVEAIVPDARIHGVGLEPAGDEILVDIHSFVVRQGVLSRVTAPGPTVLLPQTVRAVRREDAIRCGRRLGRCRVLDDRVHVRLDSLAVLPGGGLAAIVTYSHTDRRPTGNSMIGFVQTRLELTRKGQRWEITRRDLIQMT